MKGIEREGGYSPLVALFLERFEAADMTSGRAWKIVESVSSLTGVVEDFTELCGRARAGGSLVRNGERRGRAAKGMYKGVKAGRGRSEIDTTGEVSLAIPAISSRVAQLQFVTDIIADSLSLALLFSKEKILEEFN